MKKKMWTVITFICVTGLSLAFGMPVSAQTISLVQAAQITPEKAEGAALTRVGGGTVMDIELKRKNQQIIYEVEIIHNGRKAEIKIDAATGKIVKLESKSKR